jgi:lipoprotein-anchoring transpeptidase ErfK/SrfK
VGVRRSGFTWSGTNTVSMKREWPDWSPPAAMLRRRPDLPHSMKGGLGIPSAPAPCISARRCTGSIRMTNADVTDLYNRTKVGTKVVVLR